MTASTPKALDVSFTRRDLRDALGMFATGVTVVTTRGAKEPYGMTASAFSVVSFDPPLVLVCVVSQAQGAESIAANRHFAVNVLTAEQEALSRHFASRKRRRGPDAFAEIPHREAVTGAPILDGVAAYLDCWLAAKHEAGDHVIFVGEVLALGADRSAPPLLYFAGSYRSFPPC